MLIYVESKVFPQKTFVLLVNQYDSIARARAQMLHTLYELGKSNHQFRFRFKGTYLRDAYTFEDYKILDSSVIKMVPMAKSRREILHDENEAPIHGFDDTDKERRKRQKEKDSLIDEVQMALNSEVNIFNRREMLIGYFRVLLWLHFLAILLSVLSVYMYSAVWTGVIVLYGFTYCPNYSRLSGFVGTTNISKEYFLITFFFGMFLNLGASVTMGTFLLLDAVNHGCAEFKGDCSYLNVWSVMFYFGQSLVVIVTMVLLVILYYNYKVEVGDIIEYYLVQNKDITKVLRLASVGRLKERRNAAFELASLAATGDDAKHKIVEKEGLQVLMNLALCPDETTQEYATEALAELLTVSTIQDHFIELGGARTLCALLHSKSERLMNEAVMAISYIVADSDSNKHAIVAEDGLFDLSYAAKKASVQAAQIIAGIYLELSFTPEIRTTMALDNYSANALVVLCQSRDDETKRLALQTLELLAIESPDFVIRRIDLLEHLILIPTTSFDDQLCLLAGKILLYYAETKETCVQMVGCADIKECLLQLACNPDPILQSVVAKTVMAIVENIDNRQDILSAGIIEVLAYIHDNCLDRETWETAEKAIDMLHAGAKSLGKRQSEISENNASSSSGSIVPIKM